MDDPAEIFRWQRIESRLTTSGQPSEEQLAEIKSLGVTHVVNLGLHTHEKALADETASVQALDMRYVHLPVDFSNPTDADFTAFQQIMRDLAGKTIHVHCIANLRVSAFLYRSRRDTLGEPAARQEMDKIWRPGGVWAHFIGDEQAETLPHRYAGQDY